VETKKTKMKTKKKKRKRKRVRHGKIKLLERVTLEKR
jgi:hypothetical protein